MFYRISFAVRDLPLTLARASILESEHKDLEVRTERPAHESSDEAISSMSEDSADSSDRQQAIPNGQRPMSPASSNDEDEVSRAPSPLPIRDDDAASTSGASANSSTTAASVPAEPLPDYFELVEKAGSLHFTFERSL